eukprot:CAMPEP_0117493842 /NCGR_PEP_ID=MMETSP0784-20121206/19304_1 /TAXON_ID=39447 /ORGANISM="" /LENGTH=1062 /DNA_ID=CAMNT_0005288703 /DNA_START=17 /DNA_END=3206 /DNA_ORIENTATION=-
MAQWRFGVQPRDADGLLRSLSSPALARSKKVATQSLLMATEAKNLTALRQLALQSGAELSGSRAYNRQGADPYTIVALSEHFLPHERTAIRKQLVQLPQLIDAAGAAKTKALTMSVSDSTLLPGDGFEGAQEDARELEVVEVLRSEVGQQADIEDGESTSTALRRASEETLSKTATLDRRHAAKMAMTTLAETLGHHEKAATIAFRNPKVLETEPVALVQALGAMHATLGNEDLALTAATRNSRLLKVDGIKFRKIIPALTGLLGSEAEAAYAVAKHPDLLEVERPQQLMDTMQIIAECTCSMSDAVWLVLQTLVPASIKLEARPWSHEAVQGEYIRMKGVRIDDRPVYRKNAAAMKKHQFGPKARDMFLIYDAQGPCGEACWTVTPAFDAVRRRKPARTADGADEVIGKAASAANSPDQVATGDWHFRVEKPDWHPDAFVKTVDGKRRRASNLLLAPPELIRRSYDVLQEGLGFVWRASESSSVHRPRLAGVIKRTDVVHSGAATTFATVGDFSMKSGYTYLRLHIAMESATVSLLAWEPVLVYLLYAGPEPAEEPAEPVADGGEEEAVPAHLQVLQQDGWWQLPNGAMRLPQLQNSPEVTEAFARSYPRGRCCIPVPHDLSRPPLVFVRAQLAALGRGGRPSEAVKAKADEALYFAEDSLPVPFLKAPGDLGYENYWLLRAPYSDCCCPESETQLRIDTADRIRVVLAFCTLPPEPKEETEDPSSAEPPEPAPTPPAVEVPSWANSHGWKDYQPSSLVVLRNAIGETTSPAFYRTQDFDGEEEIIIRGAGPDVTCLVFWVQLGKPRPNQFKELLNIEPGILSSADSFTLLFSSLRAELGDSEAHRVLVDHARVVEWSALSQTASEDEIKAWVHERKLEMFGAAVRAGGGVEIVRELIAQEPTLRSVTGPLFTERCMALESALRSKASLLKIIKKRPALLTHGKGLFTHALRVLSDVFEDHCRRKEIVMERPELLVSGGQLEALFDKLRKSFSEIFHERMANRTAGEWAAWTAMVHQPPDAVVKWIGRISAEERELTCKDRVRAFGTKTGAILSATPSASS